MIARLIIGSAIVLLGLNAEVWAQRINTAPSVSAPSIHVGPPVAAPSVVVTPPPPPPTLNQPVATPGPIPCTDEGRRRGQC